LTILGGLAELLEVDLFGQGTVSISVGIAFIAMFPGHHTLEPGPSRRLAD
jgi:hypothetical protein